MPASLATGAFTLGGVVVGGFLTGSVNYTLARRGERRSARAAARLVLEEASTNRSALATIEAAEAWVNAELLSVAQWESQRVELAQHLRNEDWRCVAEANQAITELLAYYADAEAHDPLRPTEVERIASMRRMLDHAITDHLIQLSNHGPQRRALAKRYHALRHWMSDLL